MTREQAQRQLNELMKESVGGHATSCTVNSCQCGLKEFQAEMWQVFKQFVKEVIGEDENPKKEFEGNLLGSPMNRLRNKLRTEQRKRAGL